MPSPTRYEYFCLSCTRGVYKVIWPSGFDAEVGSALAAWAAWDLAANLAESTDRYLQSGDAGRAYFGCSICGKFIVRKKLALPSLAIEMYSAIREAEELVATTGNANELA